MIDRCSPSDDHSPMVEWKTISLPFADSDVTHTVYYKPISALEVEVFNLPLAATETDVQDLIKEVFSLFGHLDEVIVKHKKAVVKFESEKGLTRALEQRKKHSRIIPKASCGVFGIESFIAKYNQRHPSLATLERVSNEFIEQFEKKEAELKESSGGRHVARMTEAEMNAIMQKYQQKVKAMQSKDFYSFQQKDRPNLAKELLSDEGPVPRHMKKKPKVKKPNLAFTPKKSNRQAGKSEA